MEKKTDIKIAIVDDHQLVRDGVSGFITNLESPKYSYSVILECGDGQELKDRIANGDVPEIILMDMQMPGLGGFDTAVWLAKEHRDIKVIVLTMMDDEKAIIQMLKLGVKAYLTKNTNVAEIQMAIDRVISKGFYYSERISGIMANIISGGSGEQDSENPGIRFSKNELEFIEHAFSELSYKEISEVMKVSFKTVDGYRESVFTKCNVKNRVGLVIYALKNNLVQLK
jgi:DNA-binding NarL/FixJ family response regulator